MADSFFIGTTDGVNHTYTVPFPYIEQSDVVVRLNGVVLLVVTDYSWTGPASIMLQLIPPAGNSIALTRSTSPDGPLVSFQNGAILTGADLNTAVLQAFYRTQELQDQLNTYINAGVAQYSSTGVNPAVDPEQLIDAAAAAVLATDLAQTLLNASSDISLNAENILDQTQRVDTLQATLDSLTSGVPGGIGTFLTNEQNARIDGDTALANTIALIGAVSGSGATFILDESTVTVDGTTSLADKFSGIESTLGANAAAISTEASTRASADSALSTLITGLTSNVGTNAAAIATEASTRASADTATASTISSLTTTVAGHTSSISTQASSIAGLQAQFTVRIDVDGNVSGFGLASGAGGTSQFTVLANEFAVIDPGAPGGTPIVPFNIVGGVVFMQNIVVDGALIKNATITNAQIANLTVGTGQMAANAITNISTKTSATQVSCAPATGGAVLETDVISLTVSTTGSPVEIDVGCMAQTGGATGKTMQVCMLRIFRDGSPVPGMVYDQTYNGAQNVGSTEVTTTVALTALDTPSAGSHTYSLHATTQVGSPGVAGVSMNCINNFIKVMEIKK